MQPSINCLFLLVTGVLPDMCYLQIHGFVCMAAVVVTDSLDWKLHGFDLTSEHALTGVCALSPVSHVFMLCCWHESILVWFLPPSLGIPRHIGTVLWTVFSNTEALVNGRMDAASRDSVSALWDVRCGLNPCVERCRLLHHAVLCRRPCTEACQLDGWQSVQAWGGCKDGVGHCTAGPALGS